MVKGQSVLWTVAALLLASVVGCKSEDQIVGTWTSDTTVPVEVTINPDGTFVSTTKAKVPLKTTGDWTFQRPRLILEVKDVDLNMSGSPFQIPEEQKKKLIEQYGTIECSVSWKTSDEIVISGKPPWTGNFKRKRP